VSPRLLNTSRSRKKRRRCTHKSNHNLTYAFLFDLPTLSAIRVRTTRHRHLSSGTSRSRWESTACPKDTRRDRAVVSGRGPAHHNLAGNVVPDHINRRIAPHTPSRPMCLLCARSACKQHVIAPSSSQNVHISRGTCLFASSTRLDLVGNDVFVHTNQSTTRRTLDRPVC
jgi:hypothetical protein